MIYEISQQDFECSDSFGTDIENMVVKFYEGYDHVNYHTITAENRDDVIKMMEAKKDEVIDQMNYAINRVRELKI